MEPQTPTGHDLVPAWAGNFPLSRFKEKKATQRAVSFLAGSFAQHLAKALPIANPQTLATALTTCWTQVVLQIVYEVDLNLTATESAPEVHMLRVMFLTWAAFQYGRYRTRDHIAAQIAIDDLDFS